MDIAQLGYSVDSSQLAQSTTALDKNTAAAQKTERAAAGLEKQSQKLALSQKQLVMAQRQLPMQFTDIFVGLSSGQKPLQVLLQQGGQLKDVFGGVGPAVRASAGYIMGLVNPITLVIGAVGALGLAWKQQQDQLDEFTIGLAKTNSFIGLTASELDSYADTIANATDATRGGVQETVARIVAGGRLTQEQFKLMAGSTAEWATITGESVDDVVKRYEALAKDPVEALLKLNESEHFLTQAQLDRVRALVEEGRQQDAATEAVRIYASRMDEATDQVKSNLSEMGKGWIEVKSVISEVWEVVGQFADGIVGITRRQAEANAKLIGSYMAAARLGKPGEAFGAIADYVKGVPGVLTGRADFSKVSIRMLGGESALDTAAEKERQKQQEQWDRLSLSNLSKQERLEREIEEIRKNGVRLGKTEAEIQAQVTNARARYAESLPKGRKGSDTDPTDAMLQRLRQQIALNQEQMQSENNLTATERMLVQIRTELEQLGAKGSVANKREIEELMARAQATDELVQAAERKRKADEAIARQMAIFDQKRTNQERGNEIELMSMGRGSDAVEMLRRQLDIQREYQDELKRLGDKSVAADKESWDQMAENARAFRDEQLELERQFQEQRQLLMGSWSAGANKAMEDYIERARNIAGQVEEIWGFAFQSIEDLGVDALTGNLDDWESYFDDLNKMILRFIIRQQLSKWMESLSMPRGASGDVAIGAGSMGGGGGGGWLQMLGSFAGALFGGGRAGGGDVFSGEYYQVGERNQPELLNMGGKQFLIPGDQGRVEPMQGGRGRAPVVNQSITVVGRFDNRAASTLAAETAAKMRVATARNG